MKRSTGFPVWRTRPGWPKRNCFARRFKGFCSPGEPPRSHDSRGASARSPLRRLNT